jgi:glycosyltransferase involved in cell wall biosynthesis
MKRRNGKINVLHVVNGLAIGGGELKLLELVEAMCEQRADKYNVVLCSVGQGGPLYPEFEKLGIKIYIIEKRHKLDISQVLKVYSIIKREKIDLVQTTLFYADIIGAIAARLAGVRAVISWDTVSHPPDSYETNLRHKLAYRFSMRFVSKIAAVSDAVKKFLIEDRKIESSKIETIHYGIALNQFQSSNGFINLNKRQELGFTEDDIVIGTVARLAVQKGHAYLVEASKAIVAKYPNVHFVFSGDGPLRSELEKRVEKLGLAEHFHFLGFRNDVSELLFAFDIFVLPSLFEGLPNVILEAMASSRPVVATAVDGTPELIENQISGLLVDPKSPDQLSEAIMAVLAQEDRGIAIGRQARERIEKEFSFAKQFEKFESLYYRELHR